ncbi:hypothetical protein [Candidatus Methylomicrobium oryzae]|jgi:hypothetical protein|uniref:hypothetical protein n=1 Tax=Candidatus Methylomicrobium oryzae TaxID=2802053 RepID=UPI001921DF5D|nr:hypothetical protein [Methylomicrobium sp. RS1]MBL1264921.1 hypothetical protein [Methylomicrobium sp. RS1]
MKPLLLLVLLSSSFTVFANDPKNEWHNTTLSDATIKKIQESRFEYKKCVDSEIQKPEYRSADVRTGAEQVVKQCEPVLGKMRTVYAEEKVPDAIIDRHMKQLRLQTTRTVIQNLMFAAAAREAGQKK